MFIGVPLKQSATGNGPSSVLTGGGTTGFETGIKLGGFRGSEGGCKKQHETCRYEENSFSHTLLPCYVILLRTSPFKINK
jgi:hypothetical protein